MNIFFPYQLAMYLVFVDWSRVAYHLKRFAGSELQRKQGGDAVVREV
jgi:hypothetical protein